MANVRRLVYVFDVFTDCAISKVCSSKKLLMIEFLSTQLNAYWAGCFDFLCFGIDGFG